MAKLSRQTGGIDDAELLNRYADRGDEDAFASLAKRHLALVYGLAYRRLGNHQLAEEISQNAFCALAQAANKRERILTIPAWLYGTARKQIAQTMRTEHRRRLREARAAELDCLEREGHSLWEGLVPALDEALAKLSQNDQTILFLKYYEGYGHNELASLLGIRESAARKRSQRAIEHLRSRLKSQGVTLTAGMCGASLFTAGATVPPAHVLTSVTKAVSAVSEPSRLALLLSTGASIKILAAALLTLSLITIALLPPWREGTAPSQTPASASNLSSQVASSVLNSNEASPQRIDVDDIEAIYALPFDERERALQRLNHYLRKPRDSEYLTDLFTRWTRLDPARNTDELIIVFRNTNDPNYTALLGQHLAIPITAWLTQSQKQAVAWVETLPREDYAEAYASEAVLAFYAERDLSQAFRHLASRPYNRERAHTIIADALLNMPSNDALDWLASIQEYDDTPIPEPSQSLENVAFTDSIDSTTKSLYSAALSRLYTINPPMVRQWLSELPESELTTHAIRIVVEAWASEDPKGAGEWSLNLRSPSEQDAGISGLAATWVHVEPFPTRDWILSLTEPSLRETAMVAAFESWHPSAPDFKSVQSWLQPLAVDPTAEPLFLATAQDLSAVDTHQWAKALPEGPARRALTATTFYNLGKASPSEGVRLLDEMDPIHLSCAARHLSLGWIVSGGRTAYRKWLGSLPRASPTYFAAASAEMDLISALRPETAIEQLRAIPAVPQRDAITIAILERTMHRSPKDAERAYAWTDLIVSADERRFLRERISQLSHNIHNDIILPNHKSNSLAEQSLSELQTHLDTLSRIPRD